jgi:hypothetical protein
MSRSVVGICSAVQPLAAKEFQRDFKHPILLYKNVVKYKSNPRSEKMMRALFKQRFPEGKVVRIGEDIDEGVDEIVLLFPDAIGLGWGRLERDIKKKFKQSIEYSCLNGRGRYFSLSFSRSISLRWRRALEKSMFTEFLSVFLFVMITPFLFIIDLFRRRL